MAKFPNFAIIILLLYKRFEHEQIHHPSFFNTAYLQFRHQCANEQKPDIPRLVCRPGGHYL